jgi:hypothetical protein
VEWLPYYRSRRKKITEEKRSRNNLHFIALQFIVHCLIFLDRDAVQLALWNKVNALFATVAVLDLLVGFSTFIITGTKIDATEDKYEKKNGRLRQRKFMY